MNFLPLVSKVFSNSKMFLGGNYLHGFAVMGKLIFKVAEKERRNRGRDFSCHEWESPHY